MEAVVKTVEESYGMIGRGLARALLYAAQIIRYVQLHRAQTLLRERLGWPDQVWFSPRSPESPRSAADHVQR